VKRILNWYNSLKMDLSLKVSRRMVPSNVEGNKHYDDQMDLFVHQKCKKMSMNYDEIMRDKERVYTVRINDRIIEL
jgi:hypothetical protein